MRTDELFWNEAQGWTQRNAANGHRANGNTQKTDLVLYFGIREALQNGARYHEMRAMFPDAHIVGCSTGGQIHNDDVTDDEITAATVSFDATKIRLACEPAHAPERSRACGEAIGQTLAAHDLAGIFILSDGLNVNGSELVAGITSVVGERVPVTGGLAGDGAKFIETLVGGDCAPRKHTVAAVGFYGSAIRFGHGSAGGWDEFGPRRRITRSAGNVLHELDGGPALDLYERYLGEEAKGLPGTALLFPLRIYNPERPKHDLVRTVLAVDREKRSMTFAGNMPQGWVAQLMRGNFDRLAAGAGDAARQASNGIALCHNDSECLAVLVSCIGRRLLMGQHTAEEVEAVGAEFGSRIPRLGFYSYGEISPHAVSGVSELHNQTMTVTTITEAAG